MSTKIFLRSLADYRYLREKGYSEKASLKLVGDKYRLARVERNTLFRGVIPQEVAVRRKRKLVVPEAVQGQTLGIDWYNVLITVESFLRGFPLFLSDDDVTRDSSATHGSFRRTAVTDRAIDAIIGALGSISPGRVEAFLDSPIAYSGLMAEEVRNGLAQLNIPSIVSLEHSADYPLKTFSGTVASSDSVILDCAGSVFDLPRFVVQRSFHFTPPSLADLPVSFPKVFGQSSSIETPGR
jgi:hypothetical protein